MTRHHVITAGAHVAPTRDVVIDLRDTPAAPVEALPVEVLPVEVLPVEALMPQPGQYNARGRRLLTGLGLMAGALLVVLTYVALPLVSVAANTLFALPSALLFVGGLLLTASMVVIAVLHAICTPATPAAGRHIRTVPARRRAPSSSARAWGISGR